VCTWAQQLDDDLHQMKDLRLLALLLTAIVASTALVGCAYFDTGRAGNGQLSTDIH